jgi:hypothetical protein
MAKCVYDFNTGTHLEVQLGEDGYNVNIIQADDKPLMGTFTSYENMLKGIAPIVQNNANSDEELFILAFQLKTSFNSKLEPHEIMTILMES